MTAQIFVLDTETTGLGGALEGDVIVELGIARVDLDLKKVYPEYGKIVHQNLTPAQQKSWVFEHTDLTPEEVANSPWAAEDVRDDIVDIYYDGVFTAYNVDFDFGKYLDFEPWLFNPALAPCIMCECADRYNDGRWFTAQAAYNLLCPDNPAGVPGGRERHRALSDAVFEGHILLALCEKNPDIREAYIKAIEEEADGE